MAPATTDPTGMKILGGTKKAICAILGAMPFPGAGLASGVLGEALDAVFDAGGSIRPEFHDMVVKYIGENNVNEWKRHTKVHLETLNIKTRKFSDRYKITDWNNNKEVLATQRALGEALSACDVVLGYTSEASYAYANLPAYVQAVQLRAVLQRAKIADGKRMGFADTEIDQARGELAKLRPGTFAEVNGNWTPKGGGDYWRHVWNTYNQTLIKASGWGWDPWKRIDYHRSMWLDAVEFADTWWESLSDMNVQRLDTFRRQDVELFIGPYGERTGGFIRDLWKYTNRWPRKPELGKLKKVEVDGPEFRSYGGSNLRFYNALAVRCTCEKGQLGWEGNPYRIRSGNTVELQDDKDYFKVSIAENQGKHVNAMTVSTASGRRAGEGGQEIVSPGLKVSRIYGFGVEGGISNSFIIGLHPLKLEYDVPRIG